MNKNPRWDGCSSRPEFGKDICTHIVVTIYVVDFQSRKLVLNLSNFFNVCIHCVHVDVPFFVYLLDDK